MRTLVAVTTLACLALAADAYAQPGAAPGQYGPPAPYGGHYAPQPGYHHHDGFFLRFGAGAGFTRWRSEDADMSVEGGGPMVSIALGGSVSPNLIVHGELWVNIAPDPEMRIGPTSGTADGFTAATFGIGPGVTYYLDDNLYFSGTVGITQLSIQDDNEETVAESEAGLGVNLMIGKEWWVSAQWGLGIAGQLHAGAVREETDSGDFDWRTFSAAVLFSATYN
jgi:hypothetical protein